MNDSTPRYVFAALCLLGLIAIWCGAALEFSRQKRGATISRRHFRWRMVSALLWTLILSSLAYATLWLWPQTTAEARKFGAVLAGSMALMMLAFVLMIFDFYLTAQTRKIQTARMEHDLGEIARLEIERAQRLKMENKAENQGGDAL